MPPPPLASDITIPDWAALDREPLCPLCSYNLRGLTTPRCPECGHQFQWRDLTDPTRREHPYLFEHHRRHSLWSFVKTLIGGLLPGKFWRSLSPLQPSRPGRLVIYSIFSMLPCCWLCWRSGRARPYLYGMNWCGQSRFGDRMLRRPRDFGRWCAGRGLRIAECFNPW